METPGNQSENQAMRPIDSQERPKDNLPAVVQEEDGALLARWTTSNPTFASNLACKTPSERAMLTRALAKCDIKTRNAVGQEINLIGYYAHEAEITDKETGECTKRLRAVLVCDNGTLISTMSGPVLTALRTIAACRGKGKWEPPSRVKIREWPLEDGASYCDMIELEPEPEELKGKKK